MTITIILISACAVVIALFVFLLRSRIVPAYSVTLRDISALVSQLGRSGQHGNFAVFIFVPPGSTDGVAVNLQYSVDGRVVGLDWVLIDPRNIADREKITEFAAKLGYQLKACEMNGVSYLRVTGSGISELGTKIIQDFYHVGPETKLELITEGFKWQPA